MSDTQTATGNVAVETQVPTPQTDSPAPQTSVVAPTKKRGKIATVDAADGILMWKWADAQVTSVNPAGFSDEIRTQAMLHGLTQKLTDSYAGAKSPEEARGFFGKVLDNLTAGVWAAKREPGEQEPPNEILARAVIAAYDAVQRPHPELAAIVAKLETLDTAGRRKLRADPDIAVQLIRLREATATAADVLGF